MRNFSEQVWGLSDERHQPGARVVPAARLALDRTGLRMEEVDVINFKEAFSGQVVRWTHRYLHASPQGPWPMSIATASVPCVQFDRTAK